jgi:hypothetical protein
MRVRAQQLRARHPPLPDTPSGGVVVGMNGPPLLARCQGEKGGKGERRRSGAADDVCQRARSGCAALTRRRANS